MHPHVRLLLPVLLLAAGCAREREAPEPAPAAVHAALATAPAADPLERLPADRAGEVVRRAVAFATGDWAAWQAKRTVSYRKTTLRLGPDGGVERRLVQMHHYALHPEARMRITWEEDGQEIVLVNKGDQAWKFVGGTEATTAADRDHAWNATFGSHYVFSMPFKLTDPGALLSYAGRDTLADGTVAERVRVDYEPGAGSAGGLHTWTYYFDADDGRLVANHLRYGPAPTDYDFTEYLDYRVIDGVHMPTRRYGYRSNAAAERLEKVSEILYEDVRFDVPLPDTLFLPPR